MPSNPDQVLDPDRGNRIRVLRTTKGWSQGDLAERIGKSIQGVSKFEQGESFKIDTLLSLVQVLDTSILYILTGKSAPAKDVVDRVAYEEIKQENEQLKAKVIRLQEDLIKMYQTVKEGL